MPHAGLAGIVADNGTQSRVGKGELPWAQAIGPELTSYQIVLRNTYFFLFGVAVDLDHFHTVAQRLWDGFQLVCRSDEDDVTHIKIDVEIVVAEGAVLGRIKYFEQGATGIATPVVPDLIDL